MRPRFEKQRPSDQPRTAISARRLRVRAAARRTGRWLLAPFTEPLLALGLVAAAAVPVFLVVAGAAWSDGGADRAVRQLTSTASSVDVGIDIVMEAAFEGTSAGREGSLDRADEAVTEVLATVPGLSPPTLTLYTLPSPVSVAGDASALRTPLRIVARPGARESVRVLRQAADTTDGLWISDWFADRFAVDLGDTLAFDGGTDDSSEEPSPGGVAGSTMVVTGVYAAVWDEERTTPSGYWSEVPQELVPRYVAPFGSPNFSLGLVDDTTLATSSLTGFARWSAPNERLPQTLSGLHEAERGYRRIEASLVGSSAVGDALRTIATADGLRPGFTTTLYDMTAEADRAGDTIDATIGPVRMLGIIVGLVASAGTGAFIVGRRRREFRLRSIDGQRWDRIGAAVLAQLLLPAIIGTAMGMVVAAAVAATIGPLATVRDLTLDRQLVLLVAALAAVVAAGVAGFLGQRSIADSAPHRSPERALVVVALLGAAMAWLWWQVGQATPSAGNVDHAVVALPVVMFALASVVMLAVLSRVCTSLRHLGTRLGPVGLVALRRLSSAGTGRSVVVGALSIGFGLVVLAVSLASTVDRTLSVKSAVTVGGATRFDLAGPPPPALELPPGTTLLSSQDTRLTPGGGRVRVVAVEDDFVDALAWPEEFGLSAEQVAELLAADATESLPVVTVEGEPVGSVGSFGGGRVFPYRVVGSAASLPLAGEFGSTIIVSARQLDQFAERRAADGGLPLRGDAARPPTDTFRRAFVSEASPQQLQAALDGTDVIVREVHTIAALEQSLDAIATRTALDFVRVVGAVAAATSLVALGSYLASNRRERALAGVMVRALGTPASRAAAITTLEVTVVAATALVGAALVAPVAVGHIAQTFDPATRVPPAPQVDVEWFRIGVGAAAMLVIVAAVAWLGETATARRDAGEVLRRARS
ncbi:hypothetical protein [Nodularia spumigena]|uniref:hypothetical protein n=1 Tax=Nodularia spumigena TaxID=70799 RepID=UPI002B1FA383|nr:hypothetical protein [Nodularia spumigena]MEA5558055.1 hypothetical protein [Nodularia spumigena CH309]